ncbi:MAG: NAD(P)/FAD-dependent oxidoreductase [Chloroflexi bacterium]|nr:NAD(P)/FAD-dependent oxidoreductase [Chloroflexota bacterium]
MTILDAVHYDAVVIGGGLAGCMAAITLAQAGRAVALLEAGKYPRSKVCGEFLSPECAALFDAVGFLPDLHALGPATIRTLRLTAPDGVEWCAALPAPAFSVSRYALDAALADYAARQGVEVHSETRVTELDGTLLDGFTVTAQTTVGATQVRAAGVIVAHGRRSNLDRVLGRRFFAEPHPLIGLKRHFRGRPLPEHIDLHIFPGGYCGVSQVENDRTNVCLLVDQAVFQASAGGANGTPPVDRFIAWMRAQNPHLEAWLLDAVPLDDARLSIGQVPLCAKSPLEGICWWAGDAAGMIAPLAGDGMAMALHSGRLAAQALERFLAGEATAEMAKSDYARTWARTFRGRLQLGRLLHQALVRPRILPPRCASCGAFLCRQLAGAAHP